MIEQRPGTDDFWINHLFRIGGRIVEGGYLDNFYTSCLLTESNPLPNNELLSPRMIVGIFTQQDGGREIFFPVFVSFNAHKNDLVASTLTFLALMTSYSESLKIPPSDRLALKTSPLPMQCEIHNEPITFAYFGYEFAGIQDSRPSDKPFVMISTMPGYELKDAIHDLLLVGMSAVDNM